MGSLICAAVWIPLSSDREFWELFWSRDYDMNMASQAIVIEIIYYYLLIYLFIQCLNWTAITLLPRCNIAHVRNPEIFT